MFLSRVYVVNKVQNGNELFNSLSGPKYLIHQAAFSDSSNLLSIFLGFVPNNVDAILANTTGNFQFN